MHPKPGLEINVSGRINAHSNNTTIRRTHPEEQQQCRSNSPVVRRCCVGHKSAPLNLLIAHRVAKYVCLYFASGCRSKTRARARSFFISSALIAGRSGSTVATHSWPTLRRLLGAIRIAFMTKTLLYAFHVRRYSLTFAFEGTFPFEGRYD